MLHASVFEKNYKEFKKIIYIQKMHLVTLCDLFALK